MQYVLTNIICQMMVDIQLVGGHCKAKELYLVYSFGSIVKSSKVELLDCTNE